MTDQRRVVVQITANSTDHPVAEDFRKHSLSNDDRIGVLTVNRTLGLCRVAQKFKRYRLCAGMAHLDPTGCGDENHHVVDVHNGEMVKLEDQPLKHKQKHIAENLGYQIVGERFQLYYGPLNVEGAL